MSSATLASGIADVTSRLQDAASDALRSGRTAAAETMDRAAGEITAGGKHLHDLSQSAADSLDAGARYVRRNDARDMVDDLASLISRHPGKALIGAVVLGFIAGRAVRRS